MHAEVRLATGSRRGCGAHFLHPALLDGCLQAGAVLYPELPPGTLYVPIGVRRLTTYAPATGAVRCDVRLVETSAERVAIDLRLRAADDSVVALLEGVTLNRIDRRALEAALREAASTVAGRRWPNAPVEFRLSRSPEKPTACCSAPPPSSPASCRTCWRRCKIF